MIRFDPGEQAKPSDNEIGKLWHRFNERVPEIGQVVGGAYGLSLFDNCEGIGKPFDYLASVGVSHIEDVPDGMTSKSIPGGTYVVLTRKGTIDEIGEAYRYLHGQWLPASGYEPAGGAEFEYYDERYLGNFDPESVMELWLPIRPSQEAPVRNFISSVFVHVTDLRRSAEWYSRLLGLPVMEERLNGGPVYWFDLPGTGLILDNNEMNRRNPEWSEERKPLFAFSVRGGIDEAYEYVSAMTSRMYMDSAEHHPGMAYFTFGDLESNALMACWTLDNAEVSAPASSSPILPRIGAVFVDVKDRRAMAGWYSSLLGVPFDDSLPIESIFTIPVERGASLLLDSNRFDKGEDYQIRFFFDTADLAAAELYARKQGFQFHSGTELAEDVSFFILRDPDDNLIMVCGLNGREGE
jgi:predicted transcriptional regulator YdeE/catechol 2,3-dioxygenase-like lactoylglutathione lyase family enzyme